MMDIAFLSAEQVCDIQKATLSMAPSRDIGLVDGAINRVINGYLYKGISDVFELAALYLIAIAEAHAFPDANKRTAYQAALMFLDLNGISVSQSDALVEITVKAAEGTTTTQEIVKVFRRNIGGS